MPILRLLAGYAQVAAPLGKSLLPEAERAATSSIELDPDSAEPLLVPGQLAYLRNEYEQARSNWERGQRKSPGDRRFADVLQRLTREEVTVKSFKGRRSEHFVATFDSARRRPAVRGAAHRAHRRHPLPQPVVRRCCTSALAARPRYSFSSLYKGIGRTLATAPGHAGDRPREFTLCG